MKRRNESWRELDKILSAHEQTRVAPLRRDPNASVKEWTEAAWNPTSGCSKISPGCKNCYAKKEAAWLKRLGQEKYKNGFRLTLHPDVVSSFYEKAKGWKKSKLVFVNSMSDLFHEDIPLDFIKSVFDVMNRLPRQRFLVLTKRSARLRELSAHLTWSENIMMGVSVENEDYLFRVADLKATPAKFKMLSLEPLLGPLPSLDLSGIDWVACGGESAARSDVRLMNPDWVREIRDKCDASGVPFTFKQWGGDGRWEKGCVLDGLEHDDRPIKFFPDFAKPKVEPKSGGPK